MAMEPQQPSSSTGTGTATSNSATTVTQTSTAVTSVTITQTTGTTSSHKVFLTAEELDRPATAWPTVLLAVFSIALYSVTACVGVAQAWTPWVTLPVSTLAVYMSFTPAHEAAHSSVSRRHRWLNEAIGWICMTPFVLLPFPVFRWNHHQHHKHTNDPDHDPDHSETQNPLLYVLSILPNYARHFAKNRRSIPRAIVLSSAVQLFITVAMLAITIQQGCARGLLQYVILPAVFGVLLLGFVFDYIPHHTEEGHTVTRSENMYGCTGIVGGFFSPGSGSSTQLLTFLLCGQNYHAIHHLYPCVPFYAYRKIWKRQQGKFLQAGVPVVTLFQ